MLTRGTAQGLHRLSTTTALAGGPRRAQAHESNLAKGENMVVNAKTAAMVLGIVFLIVGALGFVPNPIVSPDGIFVVNATHNWVHIGSGIVILLGAFSPLGASLTLRV